MVFNLHIFLQVLIPEIVMSMLSRWWYFIMENGKYQEYTPKEFDEVPPLIKHISSSLDVAGFDSIEESGLPYNQFHSSCSHSPSSLPNVSSDVIHVYFTEGTIGCGTNDF